MKQKNKKYNKNILEAFLGTKATIFDEKMRTKLNSN